MTSLYKENPIILFIGINIDSRSITMELYEVRKSEDGMYYIYNASGILVADAYADYADETVYIMTYGHCTISTITGEEDMADNEDGLSVSVIGDEVVIKTYYDQVTVAR